MRTDRTRKIGLQASRYRDGCVLLIGALLYLSPPSRAAATDCQETRMLEQVTDYFAGEKAGGNVFLGSGLIHLGVGAYLVTRDDLTAKSTSYPLFATAALQLLAGIAVTSTADRQVAQRRPRIQADLAGYRHEETQRMHGVMRRFQWAQGLELGATATGVALSIVGELGHHHTLAGVGLGLAAGSALLLMQEMLAAQRGRTYLAALRGSVDIALTAGGAQAAWRSAF